MNARMATTSELLAVAHKHLYGNYKPAPFVLRSGRGAELFDVDGKRYVDLCAGVAVCAVGHAHPKLTARITEQAAKLLHVSNYFFNEENILLAEELAAHTCMDRALFSNSGAEANEALFKLARRSFWLKHGHSNGVIVAFHNAFHGRTMGALSMTGTPKYREGFGAVEGVVHLPFGDLAAVQALPHDTAIMAVVVEPVQGEGGVFPAPEGFLAGLRAFCNERGAMLLIDEVQTGIARTGAFLAFHREGVRPDAVALAKGLGGGFPIGAMLTTEQYAGVLTPGTHGSTYGGNALASAAARAVIAIVDEEKLSERASDLGEKLSAMLTALAKEFPEQVEGERGRGLLRGLVLREGFVARDVLPKLQERGILLTAAGDRVLRFSPPLVVKESELAEGVEAMRAVLPSLAK
jgi:acetylornithine/N-succinyldiaminopimelate aminotransferase